MKIIYFDTSALVKRYAEEKGTKTVTNILSSGEMVTTSILTYPEMKAAYAKKFRLKEIPEEAYKEAVKNFEKDWSVPVFSVIGLTSQVAYLAGSLIERNILRALDAVHLASALRNYLKTKNKRVCDTKVENKPVEPEPDSFGISFHSALKDRDTSRAMPESALLPIAVQDTFFSLLI